MALKRYHVCWSLSIDIPIIIGLVVVIVLYETGFIPTYKSGFYCVDKNLVYKSSEFYVHDGYFYVLGPTALLIPLLIFYIFEIAYLDSDTLKRDRSVQAGLNTFWLFRAYLYGLFLMICLVEVMKGIAGRPRPTFFDTCMPDKPEEPEKCTEDIWIPTFNCTNAVAAEWFKRDSYHSFPSGYTALATYSALFVVWYTQERAFYWQDRFIFTIPLIQLVCVAAAAACAIMRVTDHRNHVTDVVAGAIIGLAFAIYAVLGLCKNFIYSKNTGDALDLIDECPKERQVEDDEPCDDNIQPIPMPMPYYPDHQYQDQQYQDQQYQPAPPGSNQTKTRAVNLRSNMLLNFGLYK